MRKCVQRGKRKMNRRFREIFESGEQYQVQSDAQSQDNAGGFAAKLSANQKIHSRRSEKDGRRPASPGEVERVAGKQQNPLPHGSRADLREQEYAKQKQQNVQDGLEQHSSVRQ